MGKIDISLPEVAGLSKQIKVLQEKIAGLEQKVHPYKKWYSLEEACLLKGLNYKTACNQTRLQPNGGVPDGKIGGRKKFKHETVMEWLEMSDEALG